MKAENPYELLRQWQRRDIVVLTLPFLSVLLIALTQYGRLSTFVCGISILLAAIGSFYLIKRSKKNISEIIGTANAQNSKLEYSTSLFLETKRNTGIRELQLSKIKKEFAAYNYNYLWPSKALRLTSFWNGAILALAFCSSYFNLANQSLPVIEEGLSPILIKSPAMSHPPGSISSLALRVQPPSYTKQANYTSRDLHLKIPERASVSWQFEVSGGVQDLALIFENKGQKELPSTLFYRDQFSNSEIYRYRYTSEGIDTTSDYYSITIVEDQYASARILGIDQYNKVTWSDLKPISFTVEAADEYGLEEVFILATVAKGSGESVKFREEQFTFDDFKTGISNFQSDYSFDLKALELEPGDELFFHLRVKDNCPFRDQWTKSESIVVHIPDTARYAISDATGMSVDLLPEFFRSQRQIIIDSEKLLKIKNQISLDSFKQASNDLGFDQKMLRLKYGQFLGEENESGIAIENEIDEEEADHDHDHEGHDHEDHDHSETFEKARNILSEFMHDHDHEDHHGMGIPEDEKNAKDQDASKPSWVEELSHNHDNLEEATFFDISIKSKLRSAMSEMWDAELHLRLYDPKTSLPFQYASLELLKEIKNHARIYVQRVGFDPPLIKVAEKRLSGDQDEVITPNELFANYKEDHFQSIQSLVHQLTECTSGEVSILTYRAIELLSKIAIDTPEYLPILTALQSEAAKPSPDRQAVINALSLTLPDAEQQVKSTSYSAHEITLTALKNIQS